jgi:hypothetical protein
MAISKTGMLAQADNDLGDSSHRTGLYVAINMLLALKTKNENYESVATFFLKVLRHNCHIGKGIHIRHPANTITTWTHLPSNFSRDQASRVMLAYALCEQQGWLWQWLGSMAKRLFTHQNYKDPSNNKLRPPDIMAPGEWRNLIRGLNLWPLYPILVLLDAIFILDLYTRSKWDGGSLILPDMYYASLKYPTPFGILALYLALNHTSIKEEILHNHDTIKSNGCIEVRDAFVELFKHKF